MLPTEYVSMIDHATGRSGQWFPGWTNYEATFRLKDDAGVLRYYGGGGPVEETPAQILEKACSIISWYYAGQHR